MVKSSHLTSDEFPNIKKENKREKRRIKILQKMKLSSQYIKYLWIKSTFIFYHRRDRCLIQLISASIKRRAVRAGGKGGGGRRGWNDWYPMIDKYMQHLMAEWLFPNIVQYHIASCMTSLWVVYKLESINWEVIFYHYTQTGVINAIFQAESESKNKFYTPWTWNGILRAFLNMYVNMHKG